jgi:hypothetical protein
VLAALAPLYVDVEVPGLPQGNNMTTVLQGGYWTGAPTGLVLVAANPVTGRHVREISNRTNLQVKPHRTGRRPGPYGPGLLWERGRICPCDLWVMSSPDAVSKIPETPASRVTPPRTSHA